MERDEEEEMLKLELKLHEKHIKLEPSENFDLLFPLSKFPLSEKMYVFIVKNKRKIEKKRK